MNYRIFKAEAYTCPSCGTKFREYTRNGKHRFSIKKEKAIEKPKQRDKSK